MMKKDRLDRETALSAKVTATGVEGRTNSRFVAAVDRLGGAGADWFAGIVEGDSRRKEAVLDTELAMRKAATQALAARMKVDPELAARALSAQFRGAVQKQINKDGVLQAALEDLSRTPEGKEGADAPLSPPFLDRLEHYAEQASTDELREKWGRVLAAEVRKPGTFTLKVMRLVDELSSEVAQLFERTCEKRVNEAVFPVLLGKLLSFDELAALVNHGLFQDPGPFGISNVSNVVTLSRGEEIWFFPIGPRALAIPVGPLPKARTLNAEHALSVNGGNPMLWIYALTPEGKAICSILPDNQVSAVDELATAVAREVPTVYLFEQSADKHSWSQVKTTTASPPPAN